MSAYIRGCETQEGQTMTCSLREAEREVFEYNHENSSLV